MLFAASVLVALHRFTFRAIRRRSRFAFQFISARAAVAIPVPSPFTSFITNTNSFSTTWPTFTPSAGLGMWLALSMRRPNMATGLTILFVVILPTIAYCLPSIIIDAIFILVGWIKLSEDFRFHQMGLTAKSVTS